MPARRYLVSPQGGGSTAPAQYGLYYGVNLPTPPTTFTTTYAPLAAGSTPRGSYFTPGVGGDVALTFQGALDVAVGGDVIVLQAGTTYTTTTSFQLRNHTGNSMVYIISSNMGSLPSPGTRVNNTTNLANMPTLKSSSVNGGYVLKRDANAHHYRICGVQIIADNVDASNIAYYAIAFDNGGVTAATLCNDITIDRCYIAGNTTYGCRHGVGFEGLRMELTECYIEKCFEAANGDTQGLFIYNSSGPFLITNNFIRAGGESFLVGGNDPSIPNMVPSDGLVYGNYFSKNVSDRGVIPGKNVGELKNAQRWKIDKNHFEACYGSQSQAFALTPRNQSGTAPWCVVQDITFTNNRLWNDIEPGQGFVNIAAQDNPGGGSGYSQPSKRIFVKNNVFYSTAATTSGYLFYIIGGGQNQQASDVIFDHNTLVNDNLLSSWMLLAGNSLASGLNWDKVCISNNVIDSYCAYGPNDGSGQFGVANLFGIYVTNGTVVANAARVPLNVPANGFPVGNYDATVEATFQFASTGLAGTYVLNVGSPYHAVGRDGTGLTAGSAGVADGSDLGANMALVAV